MPIADWDCIVVGDGAAGLSAGLVLGRARRRTLIVGDGRQSNLAAQGIGGLLGHDGRPPAELYELGRDELGRYPSVELRTGEVVGGRRDGDTFALELGDGRVETSRRVLLATGMDYRPPDLPGLAELWGDTVFHCPFCHGWELRDRPLAVLDDGAGAAHRALLMCSWSDDVVLLTNGGSELGVQELAGLRAAGVGVDPRPVSKLAGLDGRLLAIEFADGERLAREGLLVATSLHQRCALAEQLGVATASQPRPPAVDPVAIDEQHRTSAPGVFAAGDLSAPLQQVAVAIAAGWSPPRWSSRASSPRTAAPRSSSLSLRRNAEV